MSLPDIESLERLPRDVSPREYFRGQTDDERHFILMYYPEANAQHRAELLNFIRIGQNLAEHGIKTPTLYWLDRVRCVAQFEDLGRVSFGQYLQRNPADQTALYTLATDILKDLSTMRVPAYLPVYEKSMIYKKRRQIVDYYIPFSRGEKCAPKVLSEYFCVWADIESMLPPCPQGFIHGDYHLENLLYRPQEEGTDQCALIDYQDALRGPLPYDLVNLLEDARVDVPQDLRQNMIDRYCRGMGARDKAAFLQWYRVLGTQFHCRVLGLFIKLAAEQGRDSYLIHINRLQNYLKEGLEDPLLSPLKAWFAKEGVDFRPINDLNGDAIRVFFK